MPRRHRPPRMIDLRQLRYFQAVAEELHFGRAAARLAIAQPALSRQIQQIEEELGTPLLRRTQRRVELLPAGALLLERSRAIQQELGEEPWFRRHAQETAFIEGWALYAEWLGYDMKIYNGPYERFGQLSMEMWRACRLVADTGIHWKGWTIEQARACFRDNSALAPHNIETELQRYIAGPGQALAYKIGQLRIRGLRDKAESELGDKFDVRRFHDAVLLGGPMPLDLLETRVNAWIEAQKK